MTTDRNPITRRIASADTPVAGRAWTALALGALAAVTACDPSSATDREKGLRELREIDAANARHAPTIPMSRRVGCDACPKWCQYEDLSLVPLDELFHDYREYAGLVFNMTYTTLRDPARPRAQRELHRISCIAKRTGPGWARFLAYLDDESPYVQVATADLALERGLDRERALALLRRVQDTHSRSHIGFLAEVYHRSWSADLARERDPLRHARQVMGEQASGK